MKNRLAVSMALVATFLVCGVFAGPAQALPMAADYIDNAANRTTYRLAGSDRYQTAVEISHRWFSGTEPMPKTVYVASGESYPDALSAAPVAALENAPLLLVPNSSVPKDVSTEISRLGVSRVVVIGGSGAVSNAVVSRLESMGKSVTRIGGADRYDTSRKIIEHAISAGVFDDSTKNVFIATGRDFPDALSAGGLAGHPDVAGPVLLEDGAQGAMSTSGKALLNRLPASVKVTAIGGTGAISTGVYDSIPNKNKQRVSGADRYRTSQAIVSTFRTQQSTGNGASQAVFATGTNFPDALAGAAFAGATGSTLWVTPSSCVPQSVLDSAKALNLNQYALLGGTGALTADVDHLAVCEAQATSKSPDLEPALQKVVDLTNAERAKVGCPAVRTDNRLMVAAQLHVEDMSAKNYISHYSKDGRDPWARIKAQGYPSNAGVGENLAMGFKTPEEVVAAWMNSPTHRVNIVNCEAVAIGVGTYNGYWSQVFGRQ